jgi:hypothetical protein
MLVSPLEWTNAKEQIFIRPRCLLAHQGRGHLGHAENAEKLRTNSVSVEAQSGLNPLFLSW